MSDEPSGDLPADPLQRVQAIDRLIGDLSADADGLRRARAKTIRQLRRGDADGRPLTWRQIGEMLGVSAQRAEQIAKQDG